MKANYVWASHVLRVLNSGNFVKPRGRATRELLQQTVLVDMRRPVVDEPLRGLNMRFMAAEAYWILSGSDLVADISPYLPRLADYSDDGKTFFGAYGPKIVGQLGYVVRKLKEDPDTRQATLTIWRENPPPTKDLPCTVAISFMIRNSFLHCHVYMRSSDVWLGLPYDIFNFSMLAHLVCCRLNEGSTSIREPGLLHLTAASSHLYEEHWKLAENLHNVSVQSVLHKFVSPTPDVLFMSESNLMTRLALLREAGPGSHLRWWEVEDATHV